MCLLTFVPAGVMPDTSALRAGAALNRDGHGFAIVAGDRLLVRRGLDGDDMVEAFATLRGQYRDGPALFHSRLATHGEPTIDNCHPFPVGGDQRTVIAHNGILPKIVHPGKQDPRSDTRITAEEFLPAFGSLRLGRVRRRFERWMTPDNLMVILTVDRRFRKPAYVLNEASGIWDGGIWYSNDGYLPVPLTRWHSTGTTGWDRLGWEQDDPAAIWCAVCGAVIDPHAAECPYCGLCLDCGQMPGACFCYSPAVLDRRDSRRPRPA